MIVDLSQYMFNLDSMSDKSSDALVVFIVNFIEVEV